MSIYAQFPEWRSRRLRRTEAIRRLVAETQISVNDFVAPLFVREDIEEPQQIPSLPGVYQHTIKSLRLEVDSLRKLGVPGVIIFGIPKSKDEFGSEAWNPDGIVQVALKDLKESFGEDVISSYIKLKRQEIDEFNKNDRFDKKAPVSEWEKNNTLDC